MDRDQFAASRAGQQRHNSEANQGMLQLDSKIGGRQVASCNESGAIANSWQRWCVPNSQLLAFFLSNHLLYFQLHLLQHTPHISQNSG